TQEPTQTSSPTQAPTATTSPTAEPTQEPTQTGAPTQTSAPTATSTPRPTATPTRPGGGLAQTGATTGPLVLLAVSLLGLGGLITVATRRRGTRQ
ncbi:MAG: peptidase, partial [Actinomycetia bacterium]|nr:peptidase [Actinomycetes bacterium]